jgi:tRNA threonylcarbamoyladenosine biosynthesis protein TsaB
MRILAIDTATERCSVALSLDGQLFERSEETPRAHADLVLPMVADVLEQARLKLADVTGIAYGRGPGAFTGVRIAIGVVQGLAFGANLPTVGISNLAAVAQQVAQPDDEVLVCMDARMGEMYMGRFRLAPGETLVKAVDTESVRKPHDVQYAQATRLAGTGFTAYAAALPSTTLPMHGSALPRAREILMLSEPEFRSGRAVSARHAEPIYLRDQVATVKAT